MRVSCEYFHFVVKTAFVVWRITRLAFTHAIYPNPVDWYTSSVRSPSFCPYYPYPSVWKTLFSYIGFYSFYCAYTGYLTICRFQVGYTSPCSSNLACAYKLQHKKTHHDCVCAIGHPTAVVLINVVPSRPKGINAPIRRSLFFCIYRIVIADLSSLEAKKA